MWQLLQLTVLWQRCQLSSLSQWCEHRCHSNVYIAVIALSVFTAVTAVLVLLLSQRCQCVTTKTLVCTVKWLQRCRCHRCFSVVSLHRWHTSATSIAVTVLFRLPLLLHHSYVHRSHNIVTTTNVAIVETFYHCDISMGSSSVNLNRRATAAEFLRVVNLRSNSVTTTLTYSFLLLKAHVQ